MCGAIAEVAPPTLLNVYIIWIRVSARSAPQPSRNREKQQTMYYICIYVMFILFHFFLMREKDASSRMTLSALLYGLQRATCPVRTEAIYEIAFNKRRATPSRERGSRREGDSHTKDNNVNKHGGIGRGASCWRVYHMMTAMGQERDCNLSLSLFLLLPLLLLRLWLVSDVKSYVSSIGYRLEGH